MSESSANSAGGAPASPPPPGFVHLHVHSEYSVLDGAVRVVPLLERCQELGMQAVAITDHGVLSSAVEFYREAVKRGIKPIIGFEAYVVEDRSDKTHPGEGRWHHLTLLASDNNGYQNLMRISSRGFLEGFYYRPRVDMRVLRDHPEGIIALTGCLKGRVPYLLQGGDMNGALAEMRQLQDIFGDDNVYVEIQDQGLKEQEQINPLLVELSRRAGVPLAATNDVHYLRHEDAASHDALLCIQTGSTLDDPKRLKFRKDTDSEELCEEFYLKSAAEMALAFPGNPEALAGTLQIAERCDVSMEFGKLLLPEFEVPRDSDADSYLRRLCEEGLASRYPDGESPEARERLEFELETIQEMGFSSYFLIVWDFVKYAKDNDIAVGPGRGSAAGSLVSYCLGITDIDPLKYDLLFERFLNPGRKSMPDIDIDISQNDREKVISYVTGTYGRLNVAQIITFGTLAARAVIKDTGRVMDVAYSAVDKLAKQIPEIPKITLEECLQPGQDFRQAYDNDPQAREIIDRARPLEGLKRNDSIHAAGVVISGRPLTDYIPLQQKGAGAELITQFTMNHVEALGLLKMDFLGLRNLDIIKTAVRLIKDSSGLKIDLSSLPLDDGKTFEMLRQGLSDGVFQLESSGMKEALREVGPTCFEDIIALVALYRPGPMEYIKVYARNKRNPEGVKYLDPRLKEILEPTYGVAVYQEQLIETAKKLGGLSPAEADDLRKAIGKKMGDLMATLKDKFVAGCRQNQVTEAAIKELWKLMEAAADYSFNKSHAAAYAMVAYQTAWLKANYPVEYMAATISSVMSTKDKVPFYVSACSRMGIEVLPPDVNESGSDFRVVDGRIRFGLTAVKNVGAKVIDAIIEARDQDGPFVSVFDFCRRVDSQQLKKNALESLIKSGAMDSTGASRKGMLVVMTQALSMGAQVQQDSLSGQGSIFDLVEPGGNGDRNVSDPVIPSGEFSSGELSRLEKETLGIFVSGHPLIGLEEEIGRAGAVTITDLQEAGDKSEVKIIGMIGKIKRLTTKRGDPMAFVDLEDLGGATEVVVFNDVYNRSRDLLVEDEVVFVKGRVDQKGVDEDGNREVKVIAAEIEPFIPGRKPQDHEPGAAGGRDKGSEAVRLNLDLRDLECRPDLLSSIKEVCRSYPGGAPVILNMATDDGVRRFRLGREFSVRPHPELVSRLQVLFGENRVDVIASHLTV
ncbi:MAG: DNA polymerase III subunit alpha [Thermoleophilia bacterium]|nr:DNA polymerase III subunit alpha [Thermoleophilia bacterium]